MSPVRPLLPRAAAALAVGAALASALAGGGSAAGLASGHVLTGSRLTLDLADAANGLNGTTSDRMDAITWLDSSGTARSNFVANGGPICGGDPIEFFGQAYGEPEGTSPLAVVAGATSTWTQKNATSGKAATKGVYCNGKQDVRTTTAYKVYTSKARRNEFSVARTFKFGAKTPVFTGHGVRAYVPRLPVTIYPIVIWPNASGSALLTADSRSCGGDCEVTDWNQRWFADDDGSGDGVVVIRSSLSTAPALLTINNDLFSGSNLSSAVLVQPSGGWKSAVKETEFLCFYDPTSWPAARRAALLLPDGCATS
jgi:hypothetical protein